MRKKASPSTVFQTVVEMVIFIYEPPESMEHGKRRLKAFVRLVSNIPWMLHGHILVHRGPDTNFGFPAPLTLLRTAQFYVMFNLACRAFVTAL